jgi:hypothetical protein
LFRNERREPEIKTGAPCSRSLFSISTRVNPSMRGQMSGYGIPPDNKGAPRCPNQVNLTHSSIALGLVAPRPRGETNAEVRATYLDLADSWETLAEHVEGAPGATARLSDGASGLLGFDRPSPCGDCPGQRSGGFNRPWVSGLVPGVT